MKQEEREGDRSGRFDKIKRQNGRERKGRIKRERRIKMMHVGNSKRKRESVCMKKLLKEIKKVSHEREREKEEEK